MSRPALVIALLCLTSSSLLWAADLEELRDRRNRAAGTFGDGVLVVHAKSIPDAFADGFHQDDAFFYFTGLANTLGAILAVDGRTHESWLFLPTRALYSMLLPPEGAPDSEAVKRSGIEHVVDWSQLERFLAAAATSDAPVYYVAPDVSLAELPPNMIGAAVAPPAQSAPAWWNPRNVPSWVAIIANTWPSLRLKESADRVYALMDVPSAAELVSVRAAAHATVAAVRAGMQAVHPGASQRSVENAVINGCWNAGARTASWWPWAMAGANGAFPRPYAGTVRYDHLDTLMKPGDLVRLDVGCEWDHYGADLGRTIPVSGRFTRDQRQIWNIFVAAYHAGVRSIREGTTVDDVFEAWRTELRRHRAPATSVLARQAIDAWSIRENVPDWGLHTLNPIAGDMQEPFRAGTAMAFEPIAVIGGQGYYLEDNFLITKTGVELLTPGVPYSADEIEAVMRPAGRTSHARQ